MSKILFYLAILFMLGAAVLGYLNYHRFKTIVFTQSDVIQEQRQLCADLEQELKTLKETTSAASEDQEKNKKELSDTKEAQTKAVNDVALAQKQLADKEVELVQAKNDLAAKAAQIQELAAQVQSLSTKNEPAKSKGLDSKSKGTHAPKEVAPPSNQQPKETSAAGNEGKILAVNTTWNFVVINQGDQNGITNGSEVTITRDAQVIAKAKVTSVEPSTSVADIIPGSLVAGSAIQVGDVIHVPATQ